MANAQEIKRHIGGVSDTEKITRAMYLISEAKLRRAKKELDLTRPYFDALRQEIKRIFRVDTNVKSRYFYADDSKEYGGGTYGCLVVTADKGLAGAYNLNVLKKAEELLCEHPDTELYVVGEYGRHWFLKRGIPIKHSFLYTAQNPTMHRAREISEVLLDGFESGALSNIMVLYTDMKTSMADSVRLTRLLPLHRRLFSPKPEEPVLRPFEFSPSLSAVLDGVMRSYISGFVYSALVDSFCAEQKARMEAMSSANRNAEELLSSLRAKYNLARQAAITQEITEISAGSRAQRQNDQESLT